MSDQSYPDFIIVEEPEQKKPTPETKKSVFSFNDSKLFSRLLRGIGAAIIMASASSFLFRHWAPGNDLQRFLLLLGFTVVLSLGGLFCGLRLKESKGARTLLGLTLAVTPINFAVLGALLFSVFSWDGPLAKLPGYATWIASSPTMALLTALGGLVFLSPICHLSFMTLGHNRARIFSTAFILGNLALLLPTRQPNLIAGVFVLLIAALILIELRYFRQEATLNTFEGRLSRGILWLPALILVGRTCYFYSPSQAIISAILTGLALLSFVILPHLTGSRFWQQIMQTAGAIMASLAWLNLVILIASSWSFADHWLIPLSTLPISGLLQLLSKNAICGGGNYQRSAVILAIFGAVANLLIIPSLLTSFLCLLICISVLSYGYLVEQKLAFFSGMAGTLLGIGYHLKVMVNAYSLLNWGSLMVLGVAIIIFASLLERNTGQLREKVQQLRHQLRGWEI